MGSTWRGRYREWLRNHSYVFSWGGGVCIADLILTTLALYIFGSRKTYAHRYIYPGIAGMILFILFPLAYTVGLAFTNYSAKNQLTLERAQSVLMDQTFQSGESYAFQLYKTEQGYRLLIEDGDERLATAPFSLSGNVPTDLNLEVIGGIDGEVEPIKTIIGYRTELSGIDLHFPDGEDIRMSGLRNLLR